MLWKPVELIASTRTKTFQSRYVSVSALVHIAIFACLIYDTTVRYKHVWFMTLVNSFVITSLPCIHIHLLFWLRKICDHWNVSMKLPYVCVSLSSGDLSLHFLVRVSFSNPIFVYIYIYIYIYFPSPAINIDTSVNVVFMADKLNAAKSYDDITHCWYLHLHVDCCKGQCLVYTSLA